MTISRRYFLQKTMALTGAVAAPTIMRSSAFGADGSVAPSNRVSLGLVDMGAEHTVHKAIMDAARSGGEYPREHRIYSSLDGQEWFGPVGAGKGEKALVSAICLPTKARYIKITQLGDEERMWWSMYDLKIIGE